MRELQWCSAHLGQILAALSWILLSCINAFVKHPQTETWLHRALDLVSWLQRSESQGKLKLPVFGMSRPKGDYLPPATPPKPLIALLAASLLCMGKAHAGDFATGPTLPLVRLDLGTNAPPIQIAAGAGWQANYGLVPRVIGGRTWDMLGAELAVFGQHESGATTASVAAMACTFSAFLCAGVGRDVYATTGPRDWFLAASIGFNFGLPVAVTLPDPSQPFKELPPLEPPRGNRWVLP